MVQNQNIVLPSKVGQITSVPIAAGQSTTISGSGDMVYVIIATAPVNIRTRGAAGSNGSSTYATFTQGTGIKGQPFNNVDLQNPNSVPIVVQVWTGISQFIDNRLIIANQSIPQVVYPTYPTANAAAKVEFKDLSGGGFTDVNGNLWLALYRVAIVICNVDGGTTFLLQNKGGKVTDSPSKAVAAIYPLTSWNESFAGDYDINLGGANINVIAHEIYAAIAA
jgi:hypothetical protein